ELAQIVDDGVAGIVTTLIANDEVRVFGKIIHHPALAFVSPIATHDDPNRHFSSCRRTRGGQDRPAGPSPLTIPEACLDWKRRCDVRCRHYDRHPGCQADGV